MFESLMMFVGGYEWVWIVVIVGVLLFGAKKIPELAKTLGKAKGEYKKGEIQGDKELKEFKEKKNKKTS
jgi:sec-independent protein translocase protein TatA|tara:strand:- start:220 stop:426 length:207 start_codon:yes stop_codon:yes gene_type:complete